MTLAGLLNLAGGWLEWPDESLPDGVTWAGAHRDASIYVFVYADGSRSVFSNAAGHLAGIGPLVSDAVTAGFLAALADAQC